MPYDTTTAISCNMAVVAPYSVVVVIEVILLLPNQILMNKNIEK